MIVGIDVHKHDHVVALIDDRGGEIATLVIPNSPKGYRGLIDWLVDHQANTPSAQRRGRDHAQPVHVEPDEL